MIPNTRELLKQLCARLRSQNESNPGSPDEVLFFAVLANCLEMASLEVERLDKLVASLTGEIIRCLNVRNGETTGPDDLAVHVTIEVAEGQDGALKIVQTFHGEDHNDCTSWSMPLIFAEGLSRYLNQMIEFAKKRESGEVGGPPPGTTIN